VGEVKKKISRNPTSDQLNVAIENEKNDVKALSSNEDIRIEIFDFNTGLKQKEWKFKNNQSQFRLDVKGLNKGIYVLKVYKGTYN